MRSPVGIGACAVAALAGIAPGADAAIIEGMPDAIVCSVSDPTGVLPWDELVFYVSAHTRGGDTLYKTLTSDPVVLVVDSDGRIRGQNLADCDGRTLEALRAEGRTHQLTRRD